MALTLRSVSNKATFTSTRINLSIASADAARRVTISENKINVVLRNSTPTLIPIVPTKINLTVSRNILSTVRFGTQGPPGVGIPTGGTAEQILIKKSSTDYDMEWKNLLATSGRVNISIGTTPPLNPNVGDLWLDTN